MKESELAEILKERYEHAKRNEASVQIHLFGIEYADALKQCGVPLRRILELSEIPSGYLSELSKGVKLAQYVEVKKK